MRADAIGLYVHIPFCVRKCNYCDFCSFEIADKSEYINALCKEIDSYGERELSLDSIFFGGGTPSLLSPFEFEKILSHINKAFRIEDGCEFTVECNPKTLDSQKLSLFALSGVNRISLGLQSIHENELKILGRIHNFEEFLETYNMVLSSGISNVNVDLMYGIPEQTPSSFEESLCTVLSLSPTHISLYGLILEEGTPLYGFKNKLVFPSEDEECDMYFKAQKIMSSHGFSHYEISNYSKSGKECRHNLKYWNSREYIGVGLSAYSYFDGVRFGNTSSLSEYINGDNIIAYREPIDNASKAYEYVMLKTRLSGGFSLEEYKSLFGVDFTKGREQLLSDLSSSGHIIISNGRLSFTDKGMYVSNTLLTQLI